MKSNINYSIENKPIVNSVRLKKAMIYIVIKKTNGKYGKEDIKYFN